MNSGSKDTTSAGTARLRIPGMPAGVTLPAVMGILNLTNDSFYDGGRYIHEQQWIKQTDKMLSEGASLIDLGAASSRPGAREVSEVRETETIQRAVSVLRKTFGNILLSIDTYRSKVAKVGLDMGAVMINDISGGTFDNNMPSLAAQYGVPFVIMHMKGRPETMQENPEYEDVTEEVKQFFQRQIVSFQIENHDNLILDPGFGFGKTLQHNFTLLRNMDTFREIGYPLMAGFSRKSMIYKTLETNPDKALNGTTILNTVAVLNGADILRVHDVKEAMEVVRLLHQLIE